MKYKIKGKVLTCSHCNGSNFEKSAAQLNTSFLTFLDLDWLNKSSDIYICTDCGRIEWFVDSLGFADDQSEDADCMACDGIIPAGDDKCSSCGWSYN